MARFLIELAHEATEEACKIAIKTLLSTGSPLKPKLKYQARNESN